MVTQFSEFIFISEEDAKRIAFVRWTRACLGILDIRLENREWLPDKQSTCSSFRIGFHKETVLKFIKKLENLTGDIFVERRGHDARSTIWERESITETWPTKPPFTKKKSFHD